MRSNPGLVRLNPTGLNATFNTHSILEYNSMFYILFIKLICIKNDKSIAYYKFD